MIILEFISKPFNNTTFYLCIVDEGIDPEMGLSVIDESLENTELDFVESSIKEIADLSFCKYESKPNYFEGGTTRSLFSKISSYKRII